MSYINAGQRVQIQASLNTGSDVDFIPRVVEGSKDVIRKVESYEKQALLTLLLSLPGIISHQHKLIKMRVKLVNLNN